MEGLSSSHNDIRHNLYPTSNIVMVMEWAGRVAHMRQHHSVWGTESVILIYVCQSAIQSLYA
jgi:hypothetical protein